MRFFLQRFSKVLPSCFKDILPILISMVFLGLAGGTLLGLAVLSTDTYGWSSSAYGFMMLGAGIMAAASNIYYPLLVYKRGQHLSTLPLSLGLSLMSILLIWGHDIYWVWLAYFAIAGFLAAVFYFLCEVKLVDITPPHERARAFTLYFVAITIGYAIGPYVVTFFGDQTLTYVLAPVSFMLAYWYMRHIRNNSVDVEKPSYAVMKKFLKKGRFIWAVCFIGGFAGETTTTFMGLFGLASGFNEDQSLLLITIFLLGGFLQYALSHWMDISHKRVFALGLVLTAAFGSVALLYTVSVGFWLVALIAFFWGAICYTLAVAGLTLIGDLFAGQERVYAIALQALFYNVGDIVGPVIVGAFMDLFGAPGFVYGFLLSAFVVFVFMLLPTKGQKFTATPYKIWGVHVLLPLHVVEHKEQK